MADDVMNASDNARESMTSFSFFYFSVYLLLICFKKNQGRGM